MKTSELIRSSSAIAWKLGACRIVKAGSKPSSSPTSAADEHVARKEAVPGAVGDDPDRQAVGRVSPGVEVLDEQLAPLEVGEHPLMQAVEGLRRDRLVDRAPPHRVLGARLLDDVFVARRAAGIETGRYRKAAAKGELALAAADRVLVKDRRRLVPMLRPEVTHALPLEPETALGPGHRLTFVIERFLPCTTGPTGGSQYRT